MSSIVRVEGDVARAGSRHRSSDRRSAPAKRMTEATPAASFAARSSGVRNAAAAVVARRLLARLLLGAHRFEPLFGAVAAIGVALRDQLFAVFPVGVEPV